MEGGLGRVDGRGTRKSGIEGGLGRVDGRGTRKSGWKRDKEGRVCETCLNR